MRLHTSAVLVAITVIACSYSKGKVRTAAERDLRCGDVEVIDLGDDNWEAHGCGRTERYFCLPIYGQRGTPNESVVVERDCGPVAEAKAGMRARQAQEETCAHHCLAATQSCTSACTSTDCRRGCDAFTDGCMRGCTGSR